MQAAARPDRVFIFSAVGIALACWQFGFNLGAYSTIFFEHVFAVWIASLAVMLACLALPKERRPIGFLGLTALASPSLWLVSLMLGYLSEGNLAWVSFLIGSAVLLLSLPYVAFVLVSILQTDGERLASRKQLAALVGIAAVIGCLGVTVGQYHYYFLSCSDFALSGHFVPSNCWKGSSD